MTNRRSFLKSLGAFAALAFIPPVRESIARAPSWAKRVIVFQTNSPLPPGNHTFTAYSGEKGLYIGGVKAVGGETLFEIPYVEVLSNPRLKTDGPIVIEWSGLTPIDCTDARTVDNFRRGQSVVKAE